MAFSSCDEMVLLMGDWRRVTGTQRLQLAWTLVAIGGGIVTATSLSGTDAGMSVEVVVAVGSLTWVAGLFVLGLRERRKWQSLVAQSSFSPQYGSHSSTLERFVDGRSVTVSTNVPGVFSQSHTEVRTVVDGVDASFTVRFEFSKPAKEIPEQTNASDEVGERFAVQGSEQNVDRILSPEVQSALLAVQTPGVCTVTGEEVTYDVPFTQLSPDELATLADVVVIIASRVEAVGRSQL